MELLFLLLYVICKPRRQQTVAVQGTHPDGEEEAPQIPIQGKTSNVASRFFGKLFFIAVGCDIVIFLNIYFQLKGM